MILVLSFIAASLVACGDKGKENGEGSASLGDQSTMKGTNVYGEPSFTTANDYDILDFEGERVTVLVRDYFANSREWYKQSPEDELDEAIAMRNVAVSEALNIELDFEWVPDNGSDYYGYVERFHGMITDDVDNGFHYYDISANFGGPSVSAAIRDYTLNLMDKDLFPYFDFSLPCWNRTMVENTCFNGRLHYISGDINLSMFDAAMVIWHNKTLYDRHREPTDPENIQELALEGYWTYEELYKWTSTFYEDSNGTAGRQEDDTYALMASNSQPCPRDCITYAWNIDTVIENPDGTHSFNIIGNEKLEKALTMYRNLIEPGKGTVDSWNARLFAAGKSMFYMQRMYANREDNMAIREMEDKYGLLPMPKFDAEQEQYATTAQDFFTIMFVLDHSKSSVPTKGEAVSAFLQLACEESYTGVRGYYFNRIIKPKFFGTDDSEGTVTRSVALFDIIIANIKFDYSYIFSQQLNSIMTLWRHTVVNSAMPSMEAAFMAKQDAYETAILQTDAWLGLRTLD
jgi:hypothetical protein